MMTEMNLSTLGNTPAGIRFSGPSMVWLELKSEAKVANILHIAAVSSIPHSRQSKDGWN